MSIRCGERGGKVAQQAAAFELVAPRHVITAVLLPIRRFGAEHARGCHVEMQTSDSLSQLSLSLRARWWHC